MSKSIIKKDSPAISLSDFKTLFYELNARPDSEIKVFSDPKLIEKSDLIDINDKVIQKLDNHNVLGSITSVKVSLSNKKILEFSIWEEFKNEEWDYSSRVTHIEMQWDFNINLPKYKLPQRHKLTIRFGSSIKPSELFDVISSTGSDIDSDIARARVVCRVDYVNSVISRELINLVSEWYKSLPLSSENDGIYKFFDKHLYPMSNLIDLFFNILGILTGFLILKFIVAMNLYTPNGIILDIAFSLGVLWANVYMMGYLGSLFSLRFLSQGRKLDELYMFKITKGDRNKNNERKRKNNKIILKLSLEVLISFLANIFVFVLNRLIKF